ncbi:uncharacterized protein LOC115389486 [Salarias fasciatus]|uniref:uncharacterized protein LOC115389486 n=1 Tax=Salarias fasciatus TaxID=181472 RepID=UPI001176AC1B|nr:uncharacterized protein LOC115389486 [Salarias fasciatus]
MATVSTARTLLFILMLGAGYSRPTKKGYVSQGGGSNINPQVYVPTSPGPYGGSGHGAPYWLAYSQPGVGSGPALPYGSQTGGVSFPVYSGYVGGYPVGPVQHNTGPAATHDVDWFKATGLPLSDVESSQLARGVEPRAMGAGGFRPHGRSLGPHSLADPAGLGSFYQPGELSQLKNTFEQGHYDTETETEGLQRQQPGVFNHRLYLPVACHYGWCKRPLLPLIPRPQMPLQQHVPQWQYAG